jgi:transposase InsO family protein
MKIRSVLAPGSLVLSKRIGDISTDASKRLKWFDYYYSHGSNARLVCRHFDVSPQTFYRWLNRYDPADLKTLESRSHRPKHVRQPTYSIELANAVLRLREAYPRWGKDKLVILLQRENIHVSASMVGRILKYLKARGILREPVTNHISVRKRIRPRPYAVRKPREYKASSPGDLVELDTLDVRPLPGVILKHFSSYDVVSKWNVLGIYTRATATTARHFLDDMEGRTPNKIRAIQIDGGSEFQSVFEEECRRRGIKLFVLPPRSPKLNGGVERANRTHTEEFYEVTDSDFELADIRTKLLEWEKICNTYRPNQALHYLTPAEFLHQLNIDHKKEVRCH